MIKGIEWVAGDLTTESDLDTFVHGATVLFHCAGEINDESRMHRLHVQGTKNLIAAASGQVSRWVQLSSTGAYGARRSGQVREDSPLAPESVYEKTKTASDALVTEAARSGAFACSILRPSIVYGSGMPNQSLHAMLRMIQKGLFCYIGRPGASANYVHVQNVVDALFLCGFRAEAIGQTFNLSDYLPMEAFVQLMAGQMEAPAPRIRLPETPVRWLASLMQPLPGWPLTLSRVDALTSFVTYPTTKIEQLMSYRHKVSMAEGIADLVRDHRQRLS